ncbi:MAG: hypothetical protein FDX02_06610 [Chlorobium sp.]|nr:MAG: hypothetical protein FDX02_06610 [Chlorobium sp.]
MNTNPKFRPAFFAIGAFVLSAVAALLITLNVVMGMTQLLPLWLSCIFVVAVVVHTVINWKQFT